MATNVQINPKQMRATLALLRDADIPALVLGPPGVGKTAVVEQLARETHSQIVILYPATLDPTDVSGLPIPTITSDGQQCIERMLDAVLLGITNVTEPTILLLDEFGQASAAVQAACAPILLARTIAGKPLPANVWVCATSNRRNDRAGAGQILNHIISRVCTLHVQPDLDAFCDYAAGAKMHATIASFLRARPNLLSTYDADTAATGQAYACPRTWHMASRAVQTGFSGEPLDVALAGMLGDGPAAEYSAYLRMVAAIVDVDGALHDPEHCAIPKDMSARYALAVGVAYRCSAQTCDAVLRVAETFISKKLGEFAALIVRDAFNVYGGLGSQQAWISRAKGQLATLLINS